MVAGRKPSSRAVHGCSSRRAQHAGRNGAQVACTHAQLTLQQLPLLGAAFTPSPRKHACSPQHRCARCPCSFLLAVTQFVVPTFAFVKNRPIPYVTHDVVLTGEGQSRASLHVCRPDANEVRRPC